MPFRILLRYLANNEQMIQKLAESYPMRRAAQLSAYVFFRGKAIGEEGVKKLQQSEVPDRLRNEAKYLGNRASSFQQTLSKELRDGFKDFNNQAKKPPRN